MLRFNNDNIITGEIKQLLKEFNLPKVKIWKEGIKVFPGFFYIKNNNLCLGVESNNIISLQVIKPYIYGESITNLTKNLVISNSLYDSYTHTYLGEYLRFYRDMNNINLMSMYNCFSNEQAVNLKISVPSVQNRPAFDFDTANSNFKIYMVPVKFFEKYTIGIECDTKIEIVAGIYDNERLIDYSTNSNDITFYEATYVKKVGTRISSPFLYDKLFNLESILVNTLNSAFTKRMYSQENNLKLFIKVPSTSTSSVVVLEGDFVKFSELHFEEDATLASRKVAFEVCNFEKVTTNIDGQNFVYKGADRERRYLARPQLLDFNSTISYPFANRLVEYMFGNVITSDETISNNIANLQKRLIQRYNDYVKDENGNFIYLLDINGDYVLTDGGTISKSSFDALPLTSPIRKMRIQVHKYVGMPNIVNEVSEWSTKLKNVCYDAIISSNIENKSNSNKFDLIGFIDKDAEHAIGEYQEDN
jgi:hypothetical protein